MSNCPSPKPSFQTEEKTAASVCREAAAVITLEARSITFGYGSSAAARKKPLYQDFSFMTTTQERVALQAPSGFGKTTLCRLLAGYESCWSGEILLDGKPLPRRGVSPVQLIGQHPETMIDPRMRMADVLAEAGSVNADLIAGLGIEQSWMKRYAHELSGGQLQRFCIARALAVEPRFVIADEISTMLDSVTQAAVWEFLLAEAKRRGFGIIFVSHSAHLTRRIATRVLDITQYACSVSAGF